MATSWAVLAVISTSAAQAAPPPSPAKLAPHSAALCSEAPSSLTRLVCELASQLPPLPRARVVTLPLPAADPAAQARFGKQLSALMAAALSAEDGGFATTVSEAVRTAAADSVVVRLEPSWHGGHLGLTANAVAWRGGIWARARGDQSQIQAHAYAQAPLDVELRSFLPPVPLVRPQISAFPQPLPGVNAVACGDIDGDGALDVVVSNRQTLAVGYLTADGLRLTAEQRWSELSEVAPVPLREPIAALFISDQSVEASSSDRADWVRLDSKLRLLDKRENRLAVGPQACVARSLATTQAPVQNCTTPGSAGAPAWQALDRMITYGIQSPIVARRDMHLAVVQVEAGGVLSSYADAGAQLVLSDLNLDGTVELVASRDTLQRHDDHLTLWQVPTEQATAPPAPLWVVPVPSGIDALAACPADAQGPAALLVVSANQLLVVR